MLAQQDNKEQKVDEVSEEDLKRLRERIELLEARENKFGTILKKTEEEIKILIQSCSNCSNITKCEQLDQSLNLTIENEKQRISQFREKRRDVTLIGENVANFEERVSKFKSRKIKTGHTNRIWSLSTSPDGLYLVSGSEDSTIHIWKNEILDDGFSKDEGGKKSESFFDHHKTLYGHLLPIQSIACSYISGQSGDDLIIASGSWDNSVKCWNVRDDECMWTGREHSGTVFGVGISRQNQKKLVASVGRDNKIKLWEVERKSNRLDSIKTIESGYSNSIFGVSFYSAFRSSSSEQNSSIDSRLVTIGNDENNHGVVKIFDIEKGEAVTTMNDKHHVKGSFSHIVVSDDNNVAITSSSNDNKIKVWNLQNGNCELELIGHKKGVFEIKIFKDWLISSGKDEGTVKIWNWRNGSCIRTLNDLTDSVDTIEIDPIFGEWIISSGKILQLTLFS